MTANEMASRPQSDNGHPFMIDASSAGPQVCAACGREAGEPCTYREQFEPSESTQEYEHRFGLRRDRFNPFALEDDCDADD